MADCLLSLIIQRKRDISEPATRSNNSSLSLLINNDAFKPPQINNQVTILAPQPMRTIAMPSRLGSDLHIILHPTGHGILDMLDCVRDGVRGGLERETQVERLDGLRVVA